MRRAAADSGFKGVILHQALENKLEDLQK
jgi:hypothetical protein